MITFEQFSSEIKSDLSKYNNSGLISDETILKSLYRGLYRFGIFALKEFNTTVEVSNGKATLPENFKNLDLAIKCTPFKYEVEERDVLLENRFWTVTDKDKAQWGQCSPCDITYTKECIVEKVFMKTKTPAAKFYYNNPILLKLTPGETVNNCTDNCKNKFVRKSPYEINIRKNTLYANFKEGTVFLRYYGYPVDSEGLPMIPDSELGSLEQYLENLVKLDLLVRIFENGDYSPGDQIGAIIQRREAKDRDLYLKAMGEVKMTNMLDSMEDYENYIRSTFEFNIYDI